MPNNNDTKRSIAAKVYYELGSVERTKAGLGNNIMLKRAAELRTAAMEEPSENGPYHWCVKSLGLKCKDGELPGVDQIAQRMGCNRNWRELVKQDEIDVKEVKWADKQAQRAEGSAADGSAGWYRQRRILNRRWKIPRSGESLDGMSLQSGYSWSRQKVKTLWKRTGPEKLRRRERNR